MTYPAHDDGIRTGIRRVSFVKVDDSGKGVGDENGSPNQQLADVEGYEGDKPRNALRVQTHGFSSHPPKDSEGIAVAMGGRSERTLILGGEHKDHRPKDLPEGEAVFYDHKSVRLLTDGDDLKLDADGTHRITVKSLVITCQGVTVTIDGNGLAIQGGKVTHDGHDIGATHMHTQVMPGSGLSGVPE